MRKGWEIRKLKNVCTLINGRAYKKPELLSEGKYPVLRVGNLFTNNQWYYSDLELDKDKYCDNGDLIYAWSASFGPRIWEGGKVIYHYHIWKVLPDFKLVHKDFLFHLFEWDKEMIKSVHGTGTTMMHVGKSSMENRSVPIPPLTEQKQIVAILDKAFAAIDQAKANIEKNIENAKELFQSKLNEIFSQKGEGWEEKSLISFTRFIDYRGKTPKKTEAGIPLITAKNVRMGYLKEEPREYIAEEDYESWMTRGIPSKGDVLFTTEAPLANVTILNINDKIALAQRIITICPDQSIATGEFLSYCMQSKVVQDRILSKGTGATVTGIKSKLLKEVQIPITSLENQKNIVRTLDGFTKKTKTLGHKYLSKLTSLDDLKKSILQKAFVGELIKEETESILQMAAEPGTVYEK